MTYKEFLNTTTDNYRLANLIYNFYIRFYCERLPEICDNKSFEECKDGCYGCFEKLLDTEIDEKLLERINNV